MRYSISISSDVYDQAKAHLLQTQNQEDLSFAMWYPSKGAHRSTALIERLILPKDGERSLHGNAGFSPDYFERAIGEACKSNAGLALIHSHIGLGWQGMSTDDINAEQRHAAQAKAATGLPFVGLTMGTDGAVSARFWIKIGPRKYELKWCESVRSVGNQMLITFHEKQIPKPRFSKRLSRTISAWGEDLQAMLARIHVGIVGTGSVGCMVAESLSRMGLTHISLFDFDSVEEVNLDRLLHATEQDAVLKRSKVNVLSRALKRSATAERFIVDSYEVSIVEEAGYRAALDCDVLFSCVDRPWPRAMLNMIAYAHLIPVVDGGIAIRQKRTHTGMKSADWKAHIAAPGRPCLECLKQYDPGNVSTDRDGFFDDPKYIQGLEKEHSIKRNENVFAFSMSAAAFEVLQFLSMVISPMGISNPGPQMYHFTNGRLDVDEYLKCNDNCLFPGLTAKGDKAGINFVGRHITAEKARAQRKAHRRNLSYWIDRFKYAFINLYL